MTAAIPSADVEGCCGLGIRDAAGGLSDDSALRNGAGAVKRTGIFLENGPGNVLVFQALAFQQKGRNPALPKGFTFWAPVFMGWPPLLTGAPSRLEYEANTIDRTDDFAFRLCHRELLAQVFHVAVNGAFAHVEVVFVDQVKQLGA